MSLEVEQKIKISRSWAAWPEALKIAIINSLVEELDRPRLSKSAVFKMSAEQWKKHVANDHQPFSRECVACLEGAGRSRPHRRVPAPDALTLSIDVCGPFREGEDQQRIKAKYFMVGVYTIPVRKEGSKVNALAPSLKDVLAGEHLVDADPDALPDDWQPLEGDAHAGGDDPEGMRPEKASALLEEWERLEVEAEDVEVRNYTLVECPEESTPHGGGLSYGSHGCEVEVFGFGSSQDPQRRGPGDVEYQEVVQRSVDLPDFHVWRRLEVQREGRSRDRCDPTRRQHALEGDRR